MLVCLLIFLFYKTVSVWCLFTLLGRILKQLQTKILENTYLYWVAELFQTESLTCGGRGWGVHMVWKILHYLLCSDSQHRRKIKKILNA